MTGLLLSLIVIIFIVVFVAAFCLWFYVEEKNAKRIMQMYDDDLKKLKEQGIIK